jgi:hypothetical protein
VPVAPGRSVFPCSPDGAFVSGLGTEEAADRPETGPAAAVQISDALSAQEVILRRTLLKSGFPRHGKSA